jgi:hypothetical protein
MTDVIDHRETLYVTDAELIRRMGVPEKIARRVIRDLDAKHPQTGFPQKDLLMGDRRYWPAVQAWLDRRSRATVELSAGRKRHVR